MAWVAWALPLALSFNHGTAFPYFQSTPDHHGQGFNQSRLYPIPIVPLNLVFKIENMQLVVHCGTMLMVVVQAWKI